MKLVKGTLISTLYNYLYNGHFWEHIEITILTCKKTKPKKKNTMKQSIGEGELIFQSFSINKSNPNYK